MDTTPDPVELVREVFEKQNQRNADALHQYLAEDIVVKFTLVTCRGPGGAVDRHRADRVIPRARWDRLLHRAQWQGRREFRRLRSTQFRTPDRYVAFRGLAHRPDHAEQLQHPNALSQTPQPEGRMTMCDVGPLELQP